MISDYLVFITLFAVIYSLIFLVVMWGILEELSQIRKALEYEK
jgi:hypothetical protein